MTIVLMLVVMLWMFLAAFAAESVIELRQKRAIAHEMPVMTFLIVSSHGMLILTEIRLSR